MTCYVFNTLGLMTEFENYPDPRKYQPGTYMFMPVHGWMSREMITRSPPTKYRWKPTPPENVPKEYRAAILLLI